MLSPPATTYGARKLALRYVRNAAPLRGRPTGFAACLCKGGCVSVADLQLHCPRGVLEQGDSLRVSHAVGGAAADANDAISDLEERDSLLV